MAQPCIYIWYGIQGSTAWRAFLIMLISIFTGLKNAIKNLFNTTRIPFIHPIMSGEVIGSHDSHFLQLLCTENANNVLFACAYRFIWVDIHNLLFS